MYRRPAAARLLLRAGPAIGRDLAVGVVAHNAAARVLDVGCGPGRVAEAVLRAGAAAYVGIDVSPRMLELARRRVGTDPRVRLVEGDFLDAALDERFDVVLALGVFEYLEDPAAASGWLRAHCSSTLVASFARADAVKSPSRHLWYRLHGCRIVDHDEPEVARLLGDAGFADVEVVRRGRRGFMVCAR